MSDEGTNNAINEAAPDSAVSNEAASDNFPKSWEEVFQHRRFKELNDRAKQAEDSLAQIQQAKEEADKASLEEQQRFEDLYKQTQTELESERTENLRLKVVAQSKIDPELIDFVKGTTEEEMLASIETLKKHLKPATGPGVPAPSKAGQPSDLDISNMTPEEIRKNSRKLLDQATIS